jgi:exonuclease III
MNTNFKINFSLLLIVIIVLINSTIVNAQEKKYKIGCIAFYNIENLFDTENDSLINDEEFLPEGSNKWTTERYNEKLNNMADVISQIGTEYVPTGPSIIGLSEIENRKVLEDLIATDKLKNLNYQIIHFDSPDERGVDVALLYQPTYFTVFNSKAIFTDLGEDDMTRDILLVSGIFNGDTLHVFVNHWPSRSGGEKRSAPKRQISAETARVHIDSLQAINPQAKIILMGDLNDNPTDKSITEYLKATGEKEEAVNGILYNPMTEKYKKGVGSNAYRDTWSLFDNLMVSEGLLGEDKSDYKFFKAIIFSENFLIQKDGKYKGYPFRTFSGSTYQSGYSDHFPVYMYLIKEDK